MAETTRPQPWEHIESLVHRDQADALHEYLDTLTPADVARAISRMEEPDQSRLLTLLDPEDAADLIEELSDAQGADLIEDLPAEAAASIVDEMESDERADLLGEMNEGDAEAILREMHPEEAKETRELLKYAPDTAGGVMVTEFVVYDQSATVADVLADMRGNNEMYSGIGVQYAYVHNESNRLVGVLRLRDLLLSPNEKTIREVMIVNPVSVLLSAELREIEQLFDRFMFMGIPVVDDDGKIAGVVQRADLEQAQAEEVEKRFMRYSGIVGGDELRTMPTASRAMLRLSWLGLNLVLSVAAAAVILIFDETIVTFGTLAMLLPVLGNVSGCSGNQAVAVSIRELTLGIIQPQDFLRVVRQEVLVGLGNGIVLGAAFGGFAYLMEGDVGFGIVVGVSLAVNMVVAVVLGGAIPLLLKKAGIDPAAAAAPMLTTVVDMCGFLLILSMTSAFLL